MLFNYYVQKINIILLFVLMLPLDYKVQQNRLSI